MNVSLFPVQARRSSPGTSSDEGDNVWRKAETEETLRAKTGPPGDRRHLRRNITPRSYSSLLRSESDDESEAEERSIKPAVKLSHAAKLARAAKLAHAAKLSRATKLTHAAKLARGAKLSSIFHSNQGRAALYLTCVKLAVLFVDLYPFLLVMIQSLLSYIGSHFDQVI